MNRTKTRRLLLAVVAPAAMVALAGALRGDAPADPKDGVTVSLCDGESQLQVPALKAGEERAPAEARKLADQMLQAWRATQGEERWAAWRAETEAAQASAAPAPAAQAGTGQTAAPPADQPTKFTSRDKLLWQREEKKWIDEGYKTYHNAQAVGGTIGISCDMCHPDGANTHAETYPKYQSQLKKVALLRDMINWCIENPLKGKPLPENDPRLRAMEAYILSTRKGVAIEPGKH
jgi:thiosulfate dehydrogenase